MYVLFRELSEICAHGSALGIKTDVYQLCVSLTMDLSPIFFPPFVCLFLTYVFRESAHTSFAVRFVENSR